MLKWHSAFSVRYPLIAAVSVILTCGFLTTNLIGYFASKDSLRGLVIQNELPLTSDNIYSEIQRDLLRPVFISSLMASDTFVKDWLLNGEQDVAPMVRYLEAIRAEYDVFTSFLVSNETLNYYHFSGISQVVSPDDPRDAWFFRSRAMEGRHEINVDYNAEQGDALTIFVNHKVLGYGDEVLAVAGVGLKFDTVAAVASRYRDLFGRNIYFLNPDGDILVRSHGALVEEGNIYTAPGIKDVAAILLERENEPAVYERNGETMLVNARFIPELDWWVVVEQEESRALAGIRESFVTNIVVGLLVIGATLVLTYLTLQRFLGRLETMAATDKLTGITNRSMFDYQLERSLERHARDGKRFSLIIGDIDHFKRVNDTLGHLAGDQVIRDVCQRILGALRKSDILARWGARS
jgi:hypothetical protein